MTTLELEARLLEIEKNRVEIQKFVSDCFRTQTEGTLVTKKPRWYELIIFSGAGVIVGLVLAIIIWF